MRYYYHNHKIGLTQPHMAISKETSQAIKPPKLKQQIK